MRKGLGLFVTLGTVVAGCSAMPSASTTTAISTSTTRMASTSTNDGIPAPDPWTSSELTLTPEGLGAVRAGMTLSEAQEAAGLTFGDFGDGFAHAPSGNPRLLVSAVGGSSTSSTVVCVGAVLDSTRKVTAVVSTPEGVHVGDPASRVVAIYGNRARYMPAPASGFNPVPGYVVSMTSGNLVFVVDHGVVIEIAGGNHQLEPSGCIG